MAATDVRPKITLACQECKNRNYITRKNRRNDPDRLESWLLARTGVRSAGPGATHRRLFVRT